MIISFGASVHERVAIDVLGYDQAARGDYLDDNWLLVEGSVSAGEFHGRTRAAIFTFELTALSERLHQLYETLDRAVEFSPLEGQLQLKFSGDGRGHIQLTGELSKKPGPGCRLAFGFSFDQTQLHTSIRELDSAIAAFPVRNSSAR